MSTLRSVRVFGTLAVVGTTMLSTAAFAVVESSCPAPCTTPPKATVFVRETTGFLTSWGDIETLSGTLLRGTRKTVLRIDAGVIVKSESSVPAVYVVPRVNGYLSSTLGAHAFPCGWPATVFCSATGTFWFDIDAMEAAHPGTFIDQPLNITVDGGNSSSAGSGLQYEALFSAQIVKKK